MEGDTPQREIQYSNREIRTFFGEIKDSLGRIESQTAKHNSRMTKLEAWRNYIAGALAVVVFVTIPIFKIVYSQVEQIQSDVNGIKNQISYGVSKSLTASTNETTQP